MSPNVTSSTSYNLSMASDIPLAKDPANQYTASSLGNTTPPNQNADSGFNPDPVSTKMVDLVTDIVSCHVIPAISVCGIVGNLLNIIVFLLQKRSQPMNSLLVVLATVDACFLVFVNLDFVACHLSRYDVIAARNFSVMTLPHVMWIGITLSRISSVLTVVISVERCIVVLLPLKAKMFVTSLTIHVTTVLACVITALTHIPLFMRGEVQWLLHTSLNVTLPYLKLTRFAINNAAFLNLYKNLVLNVLFRYVTMIVISACTGATIAQLKRYSRWRLKSVTSHSERTVISDRDARVSLIMMRVCVLFMICSLPGCIMLTIRLNEPQFDFYGIYRNSFDLAREITDLSLVVNSSANFIIYLRGGDEFRRTFCRLLQSCLPASCFRFLFRCVMRTDPGVLKSTESQTGSMYLGGLSKKKEKKRGKGGETFASATDVSSVFSARQTGGGST